MSGPKGGSYVVETAEARERRLLRDAKAEYVRAMDALARVQQRAVDARRTYGAAITPVDGAPSTSGDSSSFAAAAREVRMMAEAASRRLDSEISACSEVEQRQQIARLMSLVVSTDDSIERARGHWEPPAATVLPVPQPTKKIDRAKVEQRVRHRLQDLAGASADVHARVAGLIDEIAASRSATKIDMLFSEIDKIVREQQQQAIDLAHIAAAQSELLTLKALLEDVRSARADQLRLKIADLLERSAQSVPDDLRTAVASAVEEGDRMHDRQAVSSALATAFANLGYEVGPEFSTSLLGTGVAFAGADSDKYGVKFRLEPNAKFSAQVVKVDSIGTSAQEDEEAEATFCEDLHAALHELSAAGIRTNLSVQLKPGQTAVQAVQRDTIPKKAKTGKRDARRHSAPLQKGT